MFVKQHGSRNGRTLLTYTYGYRENGKTKHKNYETIGYLDELEELYDDPLAHFRAEAKRRFKDFKPSEVLEYTINVEKRLYDSYNSKPQYLSTLFLEEIYKELGIQQFLKSKQKSLKTEYDLNDALELLLFGRILNPSSIKNTFDNKDDFLKEYDLSLKDLYRSLDYFYEYTDDIQKTIWEHTKDKYNRKTSTVYYDCTNYYFEIAYNDEDLIDEEGNILIKNYRKKGPSKEHRKTPIIQMGLFIDDTGFPMSYELFPGNESEKLALRPHFKKLKQYDKVEKIIVVADRGNNTSDNTFFISGVNDDDYQNHDGYIFGQSIFQGDAKFKAWVLNEDDYRYSEITNASTELDGTIKHKSRIVAKEIRIKNTDDKRNVTTKIYQKQMVYFSSKYAKRQRKQRELLIAKAKDLISNPGKYNRATSYGATEYIKNINFVPETGEILQRDLLLNQDKIDKEAQFDGYYAIVTSEKDMADLEILEKYTNLWRIEETFKVTKSDLNTRPIRVWTKEHIESHFLICFVGLVILRLLEKKLNYEYSIPKILNTLKQHKVKYMEQNLYHNLYFDDITKSLGKLYSVDFDRVYMHKSKLRIK